MTFVWPERVRIVEVGPRDGLQNEARPVPTRVKLAFIRQLARAGLAEIEVASFVHPRRVPHMADAEAVLAGMADEPQPGPVYSALVPNERGLDRALNAGVRRIAVFTAASETFAQRNIGMDVATSLATFERVVGRALAEGVTARGYVSTCFVCPYEGEIRPDQVLPVARALLEFGVDEVSLGDTVGLAVPTDVIRLLETLLPALSVARLAFHAHDTAGTALANILTALQLGVTTFDASAGGLGGCPFAPGASGNLATEDLVYMLDRMGIESGVDLGRLVRASAVVEEAVGHPLPGRQYQRVQRQESSPAGDEPTQC